MGLFAKDINTMDDLFLHVVQDIYYAEQQIKKALPKVRDRDPDFSPVLFQDFAFRLYATCHEARHADEVLDGLAPYVSQSARMSLAQRQPRGPVTGVVIGAMRPYFVTVPDDLEGKILVGREREAN